MSSRQKIEFPGHSGDLLMGSLELPDAPPLATALIAHCFTCGKDSVAASRIARSLVKLGYAVLRFDFTGLGSSDGDFANTNFCLLYTSPSPRDQRGSRMPSSA